MQNIQAYAGQELSWTRAKSKPHPFELKAGEELLMRITLRGKLGQEALIEVEGEEWIFTRKALGQTINVRDAATQEEIASIRRSMSGSATCFLRGGGEYRWANTGFWRGEWTWFTSERVPLLRTVRGKRVYIEETARDLSELALLVALAWYLNRAQDEDAAWITASVVPSV
ncbi:hypothetical protein [Ktedonobacter racemifer]|uniref:Uncharacterized protein n=1 Tax=Ktedonobacter racemifer DSM 44963 TaxID=485913 RepID=D6TZA6_KTERA|nr:hypothetical protein [Ktedonobacter racemifer]EFH81896.1 hypothetical protein Krac_2655 [Ktedonobacter racemifer DSM 44963]